MKIPKGGLHNINQSSQANINDSWNVLATDENNAVLIAVDKCGTKKTVGDTTEIKNSIQALEQKKLSSFDESILIEPDGNIEGNVSLFIEYFNQQVCELNFTPIQIIGIYVNGIKQRPSSYVITLPKTITIINFTSGDYIEIQYTKLKI